MDWLLPLFAAPFAGSVLGVLVRRLPRGRVLAPARSCCERCGATVQARDLVPLLSYAMLRGRCRDCGGPIAPMHWQIELAALLIPATAVLAGLDGAALWAACGFGWVLLALAWIDAGSLLLPDALTLPLLLGGLGVTWALQPWDATDHALAAAAGWAGLEAVALIYRRLRGRDGIGGGDAKLLAALGAWLGLDALGPVLLLAAVLGLAWAGVLHLRREAVGPATPIPFGTALALAGWAVMLA